MLSSITIDNYALIEHLEMNLSADLNIITGETGAGKSILLGALGLLLGNKNDGSAIKDNARSCVVEAEFHIEDLNLKPLFEERDWEWESPISMRRIISPSGKSRAFIGDLPVTLTDLKELGSRLIDIHSQHQNLILSDETFRINSLDLIARNAELLASYRTHYQKVLSLRGELSQLEETAATLRRDEEWLTFQVEELTQAKLKAGEVEEIEEELTVLENADRITEGLTFLRNVLDDEQFGVLVQLKNSQNHLNNIAKSYAPASEYSERLSSILAELKDINATVSYQSERIESDPDRLQKQSDRLGVIYSLCQKHRAKDLAELMEIRDDYTAKLSTITHSDEDLSRLKSQIAEAENKAKEVAVKIEQRRQKAAVKFAKEICTTLAKLGMPDAFISIDVKHLESLNSWGCNEVEYLFTSNKALTPQPIAKIASGGEMSRVMLSLKALLAKEKSLPTIIFDEIDTGVSGQIADAMGEIIASLSDSLQVIDITHLPQVASKGETHFVVYKDGGKTNIRQLSNDERVMQIATMISGSKISDAAVEQAKNLLNN